MRVRPCGVGHLHHRLNPDKQLEHEDVKCSGVIADSIDRVWPIIRNFNNSWHPAINAMQLEYDEVGHLIRAFTVHGEDTVYRERLTWFSDSEHSMAYKHVQGIDGVQDYRGQLSVKSMGVSECTVSMSAQLSAPSPRSGKIASGTKVIFDNGIKAIKQLVKDTSLEKQDDPLEVSAVPASKRMISGAPTLAVSYIHGPREDLLCLFLHGIGGNKENWSKQLNVVAPLCTAASLDLRGYGGSDLGENQSTVEDHCADILRVLDAFKAKKLILCGLSFGAWIATSFAVRHPDRLAGLVLSGGCTGMSEASVEERESFLNSREVPINEGRTPADFAPDVVSFLAGPECSKEVKSALLRSMSSISSETYLDALRCFSNPREQFDFSLINMPVLLMTGDSDKLAKPDEIKGVAIRIHESASTPDVRYECLRRAGHVCNLEGANTYNSALVALVRRVLR